MIYLNQEGLSLRAKPVISKLYVSTIFCSQFGIVDVLLNTIVLYDMSISSVGVGLAGTMMMYIIVSVRSGVDVFGTKFVNDVTSQKGSTIEVS